MATNTLEYREEHGVVEGHVNEIGIGSSVFFLPVGAAFDVYSEGKIKRGRADKLVLYFDASQMAASGSLVWAAEKLAESTIRVEITYRPNGPVIVHEPAELETIEENEELGLFELPNVTPPPTEYSRNYSYLGKNPGISIARDSHFEFTCSIAWPEDPTKRNGLCRVGYSTRTGLLVQHFFQETRMKNWEAILEGVSRRVSQYQSHNQ